MVPACLPAAFACSQPTRLKPTAKPNRLPALSSSSCLSPFMSVAVTETSAIAVQMNAVVCGIQIDTDLTLPRNSWSLETTAAERWALSFSSACSTIGSMASLYSVTTYQPDSTAIFSAWLTSRLVACQMPWHSKVRNLVANPAKPHRKGPYAESLLITSGPNSLASHLRECEGPACCWTCLPLSGVSSSEETAAVDAA